MIGLVEFHEAVAGVCVVVMALLCHHGVLRFVGRFVRHANPWDSTERYRQQRRALEHAGRQR